MPTMNSINPATKELLASFETDSEAIIETKIQSAHLAVKALKAAGWENRAKWMLTAADLLESDVEELAKTITLEMGKPIAQARAEILKSAHGMRFYAENAHGFLTGRTLEDPSKVGASSAGTRYDPLGVVLAVMPWNYPIWQVIRFAAPALMAGNAGLLKHASNVPQSAIYLGELFSRAGFPEGAFSTLMISASRVGDVIRDKRVAAITLTGSEGAGRSIASIAGDVLKKAVLELGGSDPFIVMPSADLDAAVATAVKARVSNNGQACINAKRFIIHEDIYDAFAAKFATQMGALKVGDPLVAETEIGPLATENGLTDIEKLVDDALSKGATALTGGSRVDGLAGWYYAPTVLAGITTEMSLFAEEAFGPVASLFKVSNLEEAFDVANCLEFGLGSAFWSTDQDEIELAQREIESGAVFINGMTLSFPELPFGGIKRSGYGRELSAEGIREFCNLKTVWVA